MNAKHNAYSINFFMLYTSWSSDLSDGAVAGLWATCEWI